MDWELDCVGRASNRAILPMLNTIGERVATIFPFSRRATLFLSNILYAGGPDSFPFNIQYILFVFFFPLFFYIMEKRKKRIQGRLFHSRIDSFFRPDDGLLDWIF